MMDIPKMQNGLLQWFWLNPLEQKKLIAIENICNKLYTQYFTETNIKKSKYEIFHPLLRYGVIEFYGKNTYSLSPTSVLFLDDLFLLVNFPEGLDIKNKVDSALDTGIGILVFEKNSKNSSIISEYSVPMLEFSASILLKQFVTINLMVQSWNNYEIFESENFSYFDSQSWTKKKNDPRNGVYRTFDEAYSPKLLRISTDVWKQIPLENNLDAFRIAVLWGQIENNKPIEISYFRDSCKLKVGNIYFPILFERLLVLNSLLHGMPMDSIRSHEYFLSEKEFSLLNALLKNKIVIK
jgi:hypothetical protein